MLSTEEKIRIIRDKASRTGIGHKHLHGEAIPASYSSSQSGGLCPVPGISGNLPGSQEGRR